MAKTRKTRIPANGAGAASADLAVAERPAPASPEALAGLLNEGIRLHQAGDAAGAETRYREALAMAPDNPHALHLLGVLHHQKGENELAQTLIGRALEALPDHADAHSNMGAVLNALGRKEVALEHFRRAVALKPGTAELYSNIAAVLADLGRLPEAMDSYRQAHEASPQTPRFARRLGELHLSHDQFADAAEWLGRAALLEPGNIELHNNLGYACDKLERLDDAERHYRRAVELCPAAPELNNNLATILSRLGRMDEADVYFRRALQAAPENWMDLRHLSGTYFNRREYGRALEVLRKLLEQNPDDAETWHDYGVTLRMAGRVNDAEAALLKAIELKPDFFAAYDSLGTLHMANNRRPEAIADFRKSIEIKPDHYEPYVNLCIALAHEKRYDEASIYAHTAVSFPDLPDNRTAHPNKVFHFVCDFDAIDALGDPWETLAKMQGGDFGHALLEMLTHTDTAERNLQLAGWHFKWYENVVRRSIEEALPPLDVRKREGKLRVGIISSDLRSHSVARFVLPLLEHYDRDRFEFTCYVPYETAGDKVQSRIKGLADAFKVIANKSDREFAATVREDGIDILFELNGMTKDSKLKVLGYRAAPIQIYWLGYPYTTGVREIDYILVDPFMRPEKDAWLAETPLVMPETWLCLQPVENTDIDPVPPVERSGGIVTFGTMNSAYKITREIVSAWARIMQRVPNSRFLMVRPECAAMTLCANLTKEFGRHGIAADRLHFVNNHATRIAHFDYYDEMDLTLDTFPLTGGTTTCDSLWMSVPVVSLVGPGMHQRQSYSLLKNVGLAELCADTVDGYVDIAAELAQNPDALRFIRQNLRGMLMDSPLGRCADYTRNFETLLEKAAQEKGIR